MSRIRFISMRNASVLVMAGLFTIGSIATAAVSAADSPKHAISAAPKSDPGRGGASGGKSSGSAAPAPRGGGGAARPASPPPGRSAPQRVAPPPQHQVQPPSRQSPDLGRSSNARRAEQARQAAQNAPPPIQRQLQPRIKTDSSARNVPPAPRSDQASSSPRREVFRIDPPAKEDTWRERDSGRAVKPAPIPRRNGVVVSPARKQTLPPLKQDQFRPDPSMQRKAADALGDWKSWSTRNSPPRKDDFVADAPPLSVRSKDTPITKAAIDIGARKSVFFEFHDPDSFSLSVGINSHAFHHHHGFDDHCFWPHYHHHHHVLVFSNGCDWVWEPWWHVGFSFGWHHHGWWIGSSWWWNDCDPWLNDWSAPWYGPAVVTSYVQPQYVTYVDQYVAPPLPNINDAWDMLAVNDVDRARDAFAGLLAAGIEEGLARIGYAITLALSDRLDASVTAMRRALREDPQAMQWIPADPRLEVSIRAAMDRFTGAARRGRDVDALFMVAAFQYMLHEDGNAFYAIDSAIRAGDSDDSTHNLRELIDEAMRRNMFDPSSGSN